jgi:hypothetical protein
LYSRGSCGTAAGRARRSRFGFAAIGVVLVACAPALGIAQTATGGWGVTGAFGDMGAGARGAALAGALAPLVDDATAVYWNAARLPDLSGPAIAVDYADLFGLGLVRHTSVFVAWPRGERSLAWEQGRIRAVREHAASAFGLGVSAARVDLDPEFYADYDVALAYARRGPWSVRWGLTGHALFVRSDLDGVGASGFAGDLALARRVGARVEAALVLHAIFSRIDWDNGVRESRRPTARLACAATLRPGLRVPLAALWDLDTGKWVESAAGAEWAVHGETLTLRAGARLRDDGDATRLLAAFGAGLRWEELGFDYALALEREELGSTHRFCVNYRF